MATWMVHLRVAEKILEKTSGLDEKRYILGNIAPDSGVPSEDWSYFVPDGLVSHFRVPNSENEKIIDLKKFIDSHLTKEQYEAYDKEEKSFIVGYYNHLFTDVLWRDIVFCGLKEKDKESFLADKTATIWKWKKDWYDLDFLFLDKHPDFRAFQIYEGLEGVKNTYLDFFAEDAFENRRQYITNFYHEKRDNIYREYPYLNEEEMDQFVSFAAEKIFEENKNRFSDIM